MFSTKNEAELQARRLEDARAQVRELRERAERESGLMSQMERDLEEAESAIVTRESELDGARAALRLLQSRLESMRRDVAALEEKRGQAALLEVRLKERCRAHEMERQRGLSQKESATSDVARYARRVRRAAEYAPVLVEVLGVVEKLAEKTRLIAQDLEEQAEEARAASEKAAEDHAGLGRRRG